jgi:predicted DNA-binding transcriptional regulator AlpA
MPDLPRLLTLSDIAAQLGVSLPALYRRMSLLRAQGFPRPLPGLGRRYDPAAVAAWIARASAPVPPAPLATAPDAIEPWQAELDRRAAAMATASHGRRRAA